MIEVYLAVESWSSQVCSWEDQERETAKKELSRYIRTILWCGNDMLTSSKVITVYLLKIV